MEEYRNILKKLGIALIVIGVIDIGAMVYCITNEISYSSSFNIFAVVAGVLLVRGGLKTAKVVRFFSAFMLTGMAGVALTFPLFIPPSLLLAQFKIYPLQFISSCILGISVLGFLVWAVKSLSSDIINEVMERNGIQSKTFLSSPRTAVFCGLLIVISMSIFMPLLLKGESAEMAKVEAMKQVTGDYNFAVSSLSIFTSGNGKTSVYGVVTAYNDTSNSRRYPK